MRRSRLLQLLGLSLAVLLVLALVAEVGLRVFAASRGIDAQAALELAHPEGGLYVPHPYMGYTLRHVPGSPDRNRDGLRGPEVERHKPPGVVRILCLGGSTTYGSGLTAEEAYPARLGALLAPLAAPGTDGGGRRYEVLNCGVPGYSTAESLIDLELRLLEFEPDAIVIYHGVNDARLVQARGFQPDYSHMRVAWREPRLSALSQWLWVHSYAYAWLARAGGFGPKSIRLEDLIYVEGYDGLYVPAGGGAAAAGAGAEGAEVNGDGVAAFIRNIDSMVALARARGVEVLLTTFPMRGGPDARVDGQNFAPTVGAMNRALLEYARAQGVPLCDFAAALDERRELFQDQAHLTAEGAAVQAEMVLKAARAAGEWGLRR